LPSINAQPQSTTNIAGTTANFSANASGTPAPAYQWQFNGADIPGSTTSGLSIPNVQLANAGNYTVIASNSVGSVTSSVAVLTVWVPPSFVSQPQSITNIVGTTPSFSASATGTPMPVYQWQFNGANILGQTATNFAILNVQLADAGNYSLIASNAAGSVTSAVAVLTVVCPAINLLPANLPGTMVGSAYNQNLTASGGGGSYSFAVTVGSLPQGFNLSPAGALTGTASVLGTNNFTVTATDTTGCTGAQVYSLAVTGAPPAISIQPQSLTNLVGTTANFSVTASGTPAPSYQWLFNGATIPGATASAISVANLQLSNAGPYRVVVANPAGSVTSSVAVLTVVCPSITLSPSTLPNGTAGVPYSQTLSASGGVGSYSFAISSGGLLPGLSLSPTGSFSGTATISGSTNFTVLATDSYGCGGGQNYSLTMSGGTLAVSISPAAVTNEAGTPVSFTATCSSSLPVTYRWLFRGTNLVDHGCITGSTSSNLTISCVQAADAGSYTVAVSNATGTGISPSSTLVVTQFVFLDPNLEEAIRCTLSESPLCSSLSCVCPLTRLDLSHLTVLWAKNRQITNLSGLQWAINLTGLFLDQNSISDLTPLQGLPQLASLELYQNPVTNLAPLASLSNSLTCLTLGWPNLTAVSDYTPLARLQNLTTLSVRNAEGNDLTLNTSNVQNLSHLTSLTLWWNNITNIAPLAGLTNLNTLDLRWNSISNFAPLLAGPTNIANLYLGHNALPAVPFLQSFGNLRLLNLDSNAVTDLTPLAGLTTLSYLSANFNPITNYSSLATLSSLANLELRGNSLSNLNFLTSVPALNYVDLAFNSITNITPLSSFTNLNSVVLAGNPISSYTPLNQISALSNLWLHDNAISNASFLGAIPRLNHLNLDANNISDISWLSSLTNLTGLSLCRNPLSGYLVLAGLTNLTALRLEGNCLKPDLLGTFLPSLGKLTFLDLIHNEVNDLSPLVLLSNLQELYLRRNRLRDLTSLGSLPPLVDADVTLNALDVSPGSTVSTQLCLLQCPRTLPLSCPCASPAILAQSPLAQGLNINYLPQDQPPVITPVLGSLTNWFIACNAASACSINSSANSILDFVPSCETGVTNLVANSSNPSLISIVSNPLPGSNPYTLSVNTGCDPINNRTTITLTSTADDGLTTSSSFVAVVVQDVCISTICPSIDPNLLAALLLASGKTTNCVSTLDLLRLTSLTASGVSSSNSCVWTLITNLNSLSISGSTLTSLSFLTNLPNLTSLSLPNNVITDFSPLAGLTNLTFLDLSGDSLTNLNFLTNLTRLTGLDLSTNPITAITNLVGLTNLTTLYLAQERLNKVTALTNLLKLNYVDVTLNLLSSLGSSGIQALLNRNVTVIYQPQRTPPWIDVRTNWFVPPSTTSFIPVYIWDTGPANQQLRTGVRALTSGLGVTFVPSITNLWILGATPGASVTNRLQISATNDVGLVSNSVIQVVATTFVPVDSQLLGNFSWTNHGDALWFGQNLVTLNGNPTAQSGAIGNHQQSILETGVVGPGILTFWWKVSSEAGYDWLQFIMDGQTNQISGEVDWQQQVVPVPPGPQTLTWRYVKDNDNSVGLDAGWLDPVTFERGVWLDIAGRPTNGQALLTLHAIPGDLFGIMVSTNLGSSNWVPLAPLVVPTNFSMPYIDSNATSTMRFYKLHDYSQ
jgi:Leucine-rich repeat (LRR) protein